MKHNNTTLEHESEVDKYKNCREYLEHFIKENDIKGRIRWDDGKRATNLLSSCVITEAYQKMTKEERDEYFKDGLSYFKECYPDYKILDATIHRDEGYYDEDHKWQKGLDHLQICSIPLYHDKDKDQYEISTTKAEKAHLIREMEKQGKDTSHVDSREQRQYLHDGFVDFNRARGRDFDYKSSEEKQTRLDVKAFKKLQNQQKALEREREKLEQERNELDKAKFNNDLEKARNQKLNETNKRNYAIIKSKEESLNDREREIESREKELKIRENKQSQFKIYFDKRESFCQERDINEYTYEKAIRAYEKTGDISFDYYSKEDCRDYQGTLFPECINPSRNEEERNMIYRQCENAENGRDYRLIPERLITHLETKEPEQGERSLDDILKRAEKQHDRER